MPTLIIRTGSNTPSDINRNVNDGDAPQKMQILNGKLPKIENNAAPIHTNNLSSTFTIGKNHTTSNINGQIQEQNYGKLSIIVKEKSNADSNSRSSIATFPSKNTSKQNLNQIQNKKLQSIVNENYNNDTSTVKNNTVVVKIEENVENMQSSLKDIQMENEKVKGRKMNLEQTKEQSTGALFDCTNKQLCKKEEMEYETEHCCLIQQIQYVQNQIPSLRQQQEQSLDRQHSVRRSTRKRKQTMDAASTHVPKIANTKCNDNSSDLWERNYQFLCTFYQREGHCNVPARHVEDGMKLGTWLGKNRTLKKKGRLKADRIARLNELGVFWDIWDINYQLLVQVKKREGHCNIPKHFVEDGSRLGVWLDRQRKLQQEERLDKNRLTRLNELGMVWHVSAEQWEISYQRLCQFRDREGHCNVSSPHMEDGIQLGYWLDRQRQLKKNGTLDSYRIARLNEIGFVWDLAIDRWEKSIELLISFRKREGHCNMPCLHVEDGIAVGRWLSNQRVLKKKGTLNSKRAAQLDGLGMIWDISREKWDANYQLLCNFFEREGHCNVSWYHREDGRYLGHWMDRNRQSKKNGSLDSDQLAKLNELDIDLTS